MRLRLEITPGGANPPLQRPVSDNTRNRHAEPPLPSNAAKATAGTGRAAVTAARYSLPVTQQPNLANRNGRSVVIETVTHIGKHLNKTKKAIFSDFISCGIRIRRIVFKYSIQMLQTWCIVVHRDCKIIFNHKVFPLLKRFKFIHKTQPPPPLIQC
jgi:hypothetical protein